MTSAITIPARAHPLARAVFAEMSRRGVGYKELERRSGVGTATLLRWRSGVNPTVGNLLACLNALGLDLRIVPCGAEAQATAEK